MNIPFLGNKDVMGCDDRRTEDGGRSLILILFLCLPVHVFEDKLKTQAYLMGFI